LDLDAGPRAEADAADQAVDLPPGAPKSVGFGVVLVTYAGVQFAPERARTKNEAKALAAQLLETAKGDFAAAVKKGDRGSTEDAGHIPRGVLEPAIEKALFTLGKGEVHGEPLDTPRGYWIVRRNQ
jgi:parvulin-like peptidyl-prolyl isomerase